MFYTIRTDKFAEQLRAIRIRRKMSQVLVSEKTGINEDTLRRLEKGDHIPRFETLCILSKYYKEDLHALLQRCMQSEKIWFLYQELDQLITKDNAEQVLQLIHSFRKDIAVFSEGLIDVLDLEQIRLFLDGMEASYAGNEQISITHYMDALKVFNPELTLEHWKDFPYSGFELRILFSLASELGFIRNVELSNEILLFLLSRLDAEVHANYFQKLLITKIYASLAYNFHRLSDDVNAVKYAELGISYCIENQLTSYLPLMLLRKGVGLVHLEKPEGIVCLDQAIQLLSILGNHALMQKYIEIKRKLLQN